MRQRIINSIGLALLSVAALAACTSADPTATPVPAQPTNTPEPGATAASPAPSAEPLLVVTSIYPMQRFAERIGGERVRVVNLVSPGVEPHAFEPAPSDLRRLADAAVIAANGLAMEPWLDRAIEALGDDVTAVVVKTADEEADLLFAEDDHAHDHGDEDEDDHGDEDGDDHGDEDEDDHGDEDEDDHGDEGDHGDEDEDDHGDEDGDDHGDEDGDDHGDEDGDDHGDEDEDDHGDEDEDDHGDEDGHGDEGNGQGEIDPHVWNDPLRAARQAERLADALIEADPEGADFYRANLAALTADLRVLHADFEAGLASCRHRQFITSHAAYGYLAARYGLEQTSLAGLSPDAEPTAGRLAEITDLIRETGIGAVLVEPLLSGASESALAQEAGVRQLPIHPLGSVTPAELAEHGGFIGLMRDTLNSLRIALECA